jgi:flagellar basal body-associated protein FliL
MQRKEVSEMEEKKESGLPIWVLIVVIGISVIIALSFILFLK